MTKNEISLEEFDLRIQKLRTDAIPLLVVFAAAEGMVARLFGTLSSASAELGLLFVANREVPMASATISTFVLPGSKLFFATTGGLPATDPDQEELELLYGNACLAAVFPTGARLTIFFTM